MNLKRSLDRVLEDVQVRVYTTEDHVHVSLFFDDIAEFERVAAHLPASLLTDERWLTDDKRAQIRNRFINLGSDHVLTTFLAPIERLPIVAAEDVGVAA